MNKIFNFDHLIYKFESFFYLNSLLSIIIKVLVVLIFILFMLRVYFKSIFYISKMTSLLSIISSKFIYVFYYIGSFLQNICCLNSWSIFASGLIIFAVVFSFINFAQNMFLEQIVFYILGIIYIWAFIHFIISKIEAKNIQNRGINRIKTQGKSANSTDSKANFSMDTANDIKKGLNLDQITSSLRTSNVAKNILQNSSWTLKVPPKSKQKKIYDKKFYESREWRELRFKILRDHGRKCALCQTTEGSFHVDHIKPRSKYPHLELEPSNLQVLCEDCNLGKTNNDDDRNNFRLLT